MNEYPNSIIVPKAGKNLNLFGNPSPLEETECGSNFNKPYLFSFFSGAGFLDLGFEKAGYTIAYANEIHKPFLDAYRHSRQKMHIPEPLYGYFAGDVEDCLLGQEAERLGRLVKAAKLASQPVGFIWPALPRFFGWW
ncbi:MAG: DNA cytosine methyltransferase [Methylovulum sp.]|uniref:DNA cytosine methyltransferase n=1 Tax=Methylovulum sp. TaxID=1916980 RepID=UPI0026396194|nr:DNA cytosine methyltransferase [Methylovulum sp.]MDD2723004.1 DNA cytosine methyltransferase [Methylovulum sp.]MDD5125214.1 DNA cytosine methyltransferase [Methylovulum sp.]